MTLAQTERAALADLFGHLGPDQPTLCDGWDTADLLAHLLVRERRLDAALGVLIKPLAGWTARVSAGYRSRPWADQIELYRSGPPGFSPLGWGPIDEKANGMEMFIHHEDARRGQPDWEPRDLSETTRSQLIPMLTSGLMLRSVKKAGIPMTAWLTDTPGGHDRPIVLVPSTELVGGDGSAEGVTLHGGVAEILLWLSGRSQVRLEFAGDPAAVAAVRAGRK
ncbi:uncharacterized protein (TIGR03085 family) [Nakamurella sp. UYEF19]|uniref:TIGR03085 family metal-binding protein n=1 Tax=Nakamurella sp. UYEF19 TaxID=1756392 RepID=UPI003397AB94